MLILITGPSASGKSTLRDYYCRERAIPMVCAVTTRPPREGEVEIHKSVTADDFAEELKAGHLCLVAENHGHSYGYRLKDLRRAEGAPVIVEVDSRTAIREGATLGAKVVRVLPWPVDSAIPRIHAKGDGILDRLVRLQEETDSTFLLDRENAGDILFRNTYDSEAMRGFSELLDLIIASTTHSPEASELRTHREQRLSWQVITLFCAVIIATNFAAQWQASIWRFTVTVALLIYPITFLITDYLNEVYGKRLCRKLIFVGFLVSVVPSVYVSTIQITAGSLLAYLVAQLHDVWAFHWWRSRTKGRFLWLRSNASTIMSQAIDTIIFTTIAFSGVLDWTTIVAIMYTEFPIKVAYSIVSTGPLYYLVWRFRKRISGPDPTPEASNGN